MHTPRAVVLNTLGLLVALPFFAYGLMVLEPAGVSHGISDMFANASVAVTAGVDPNPYNSVAAQLQEKERMLNEREAQLANSSHSSSEPDSLALWSLLVSSALFVLVALNFYLDWRRGHTVNPLVVRVG